MSAPYLPTKDEFAACFAASMRNVTATAQPIVDVWAYVEAIALPLGRVSEIRDVSRVYRNAVDRFDQVLIGTNVVDFFLVVVVDLANRSVRGHHLLDLAAEYGVPRA